jgi:streptogramin lyase
MIPSQRHFLFVSSAVLALASVCRAQQPRTYTLDADFDEGVLLNVNHDVVHDQLQLNVAGQPGPFPFINVAASGSGTLIRINTETGAILGEFATSPDGFGRNPSRTAVDSQGNVWVGNRDESSGGQGSVVKIGLCIGGVRVDANGTPNPNGLYLKGPFRYNTCVDRNNDGLIRTSRGLGDVLAWPNVTDGAGGADGVVQDAVDEAILVYQRTSGVAVRHVSVDASDDVYVGGYPFVPTSFNKLNGRTGAVLSTFAAPGCGGHGGVIDGARNLLWSTAEADNTVLRYDLTSGTSMCIPVPGNHGLALDRMGNVWVNQFLQNSITKILPDGTIAPGFPKTSGGPAGDRAVCVTPIDGHVWSDNSFGQSVSRLDSNGTLLKVIDLGADGVDPRGLAVDSKGKVWATCTQSNTAKRIDPNGGGDGLGAVDLTVPLGRSALPYDFSDMTGIAPFVNLNAGGFWQVTYDSTVANTQYGKISWNATVPQTTGLVVEFRASDNVSTIGSLPFTAAQNGVAFSGVFGRYVDIRVSMTRLPTSTATPILFDLTIEPLGGGGPGDECPTAVNTPGSLLVFPEFDNRFGDTTLLTVTNTAENLGDVNVEFVYIGRVGGSAQFLNCLEFNRTHTLTPKDTLSVLTSAHNPNLEQGYVYVFAKSKSTGAAIVHNHLIGNTLIIDGINSLSHAFDPYVFLGIGADGTTTDDDNDGRRDLNGVEYSCVGDELLIPRFLGQGGRISSSLILINLTGSPSFTATVDLLVYNDNEEVFSGQTSFQCWRRFNLPEISGVFNQVYLASTNHDPAEILGAPGYESGWFRLDGNNASSTAAYLPDPALLALYVERISNNLASDLPFETGSQENGDLLLLGPFGDSTP